MCERISVTEYLVALKVFKNSRKHLKIINNVTKVIYWEWKELCTAIKCKNMVNICLHKLCAIFPSFNFGNKSKAIMEYVYVK